MNNSLIYHICSEESWKAQSNSSEYTHPSLTEENFIHCSEDHQIQGVLSRYFEGLNDLIRLTIDKTKVYPKLQYDESTNGEVFPHIYGPINKDAIIDIQKIR